MTPITARSLSWRLWQRIKRKNQSNPLYIRTSSRQGQANNWLAIWFMEVNVLFFSTPLVMVTFPFIPFMLMFTHTFNGFMVAINISTIINHERRHNTLDLLTLIPPGKSEALWLLALGAIHQTDAYRNLTRWRTYLWRITPVSLCVYGLFLALNLVSGRFGITLRNGLFFMVFLPALATLLFNWDSAQSIVTAALSGLIASTMTDNHDDARILAGIMFFGIQLLHGVLLWFLLRPLLGYSAPYYVANPDQWTPFLFQTTVYLIYICTLYILVREGIIRLLWQMFQRKLYE